MTGIGLANNPSGTGSILPDFASFIRATCIQSHLVAWMELVESRMIAVPDIALSLVIELKMVQYRRNRVLGGRYFFTITLRDRKSALLIDHIDLLREAVRKTREARPFTIEAWVVLPEHMHAI